MNKNRLRNTPLILLLTILLSGCQTLALVTDVFKSSQDVQGSTKSIGASSIQKPARSTDNSLRERYGYLKTGSPYQVKNIWYYPKEVDNFTQEGIASWYGKQFHGKPTANGAVFDMNLVSAAHKTLPMPSVVRVTNLENNRSMNIVVNDRGPFVSDRVIDISHRGAELLGFIKQGTVLVRVELLKNETLALLDTINGKGNNSQTQRTANKNEPPLPVTARRAQVRVASINTEDLDAGFKSTTPENVNQGLAGLKKITSPSLGEIEGQDTLNTSASSNGKASNDLPVYIQAGAFKQYANAIKAKAILFPLAPTEIQQINTSDGLPLFRVKLGPFNGASAAQTALSLVQQAGYTDAQMQVIR